MNVLSVTSECVPLVKTGGLADVAGALPGALKIYGMDMRTLLPGYPAVLAACADADQVKTFADLFGGPGRVLQASLGDTVLYILDVPHLFDRPGTLYLNEAGQDWDDNPLRFAALSKAAALIAADGIDDWHPQVLHLHDWQAALAPVYVHALGIQDRVKTLLTIHNIAFQGIAPAELRGALDLPDDWFNQGGYEYWGKISALKGGIVYADRVSTVSPTYAEELMTPEFGMGMEGVLKQRGGDFTGILNGIDLEVWKPDYKSAKGKPRHTSALRAEFDLPETDGPLCVVISRLTSQKGLDLLLEALPALLDNGGQLALLGSGDKDLEAKYLEAAQQHAGVSVKIGYDEALAQRMIAGGEAILVPSRFEPCGLTQLYGLRFGTLPLVSLTGGLADTVVNASAAGLAAKAATGLQFYPTTTHALASALIRMCKMYKDAPVWAKLVKNAMSHPVGWETSAGAYAALFQEMMPQE